MDPIGHVPYKCGAHCSLRCCHCGKTFLSSTKVTGFEESSLLDETKSTGKDTGVSEEVFVSIHRVYATHTFGLYICIC
jgi:uncharacterized radical SAM superfamily protein